MSGSRRTTALINGRLPILANKGMGLRQLCFATRLNVRRQGPHKTFCGQPLYQDVDLWVNEYRPLGRYLLVVGSNIGVGGHFYPTDSSLFKKEPMSFLFPEVAHGHAF